MRKVELVLAFCFLLCVVVTVADAQKVGTPTTSKQETMVATADREIRAFYEAYGQDLRLARRAAVADRYDRRGYYRLGDGQKTLVSFEDAKERYLTSWTPPKSFEWKNLSFEILSEDAANVVGLFDWQAATGEKTIASYSALLLKRSGKWAIRVEDESLPQVLYTIEMISGDRNKPGLYKYKLTAQPTGSIAAHRHSSDMKITVRKGRKLILMGDLETAKVQVFEVGSTFVIPANTWHMEWWETETVEEIEVIVPMKTERASPLTPRVF